MKKRKRGKGRKRGKRGKRKKRGKKGKREKMEDLSYMHPKVKNGIKGIIRNSFKRYSEIYREVLKVGISQSKGPKGGKRYNCAACGLPFDLNSIELDHIHPVVEVASEAKRMSLESYYKAIWTEDLSNLQILCKECHKTKTKIERKQRAELRPVKKIKTKKVNKK